MKNVILASVLALGFSAFANEPAQTPAGEAPKMEEAAPAAAPAKADKKMKAPKAGKHHGKHE